MREAFAFKVRKQLPESTDTFHEEDSDPVVVVTPHEKKKRDRRAPRSVPSPHREGGTNSIKFCSRSEAICAELLRRFVPHFDLQEGITFQVPIGYDERGNTYTVDFLVDGVLFEYHPVRFFRNKKGCGDFRDHDEYKTYTRVYHALKVDKRDFFHEVMKARLTENYFRKRRALLDRHPLFRRTELVVATSPEELYRLIIKRFGRNYPHSEASFVELFLRLQHTLP